MPEKIEITKENILDKEHKLRIRQNGARLYCERMCREGRYDEAKRVCAKWGIAYPPGSDGVIPQVESPEVSVATEESPAVGDGVQGDPATGGGNASTGADLPIETAPQAPIAPVEEPAVQAAPVEFDHKPERKARIYGSCINSRMMRIQFVDNGEMATMYKIRKSYGRNDVVNVEWIEGTPGVNALYREIWRPL